MTQAFVFTATSENFSELVIANSAKGLVLVNYWSPNAGPCMILMNRLTNLAGVYQGRFLLATVNTDEQPRLTRDKGITSIPTTKLYRNGNIIHTIHGPESENELKRIINHFLAKPVNKAHAAGIAAFRNGNIDQAYTLMAEAAMAEPENPAIPLDLAKMLITGNDHKRALDLLQSLPVELRANDEIATLLAHLEFITTAQTSPPEEELQQRIATNPDDLEARYQLCSLLLLQDSYKPAMEQLLEITRRNREFKQDIGRRGLLALFNVLANEQALVAEYRARLSSSLH